MHEALPLANLLLSITAHNRLQHDSLVAAVPLYAHQCPDYVLSGVAGRPALIAAEEHITSLGALILNLGPEAYLLTACIVWLISSGQVWRARSSTASSGTALALLFLSM